MRNGSVFTELTKSTALPDREEILEDYRICCLSREASLLARREVLTGKAKFGITGDGKEVPQVAMAKAFKKGDWRSGYYRDQTFMMALGLCTVEDFFAQLYADPENDPFSGGRQMNSHFATPTIDTDGQWVPLAETYNISSDISSTAGQMARALGLALASKQYRENEKLETPLSNNGNEVCFCTIGDASTSEGVFWETMNAAGVMEVPLAVSVWDDGYGISVPTEFQTTKASISAALRGLEKEEGTNGIRIYEAKAWDYPSLVNMYAGGIERIRKEHVPALFHVSEVTQPQGHSTSGSHERYKTEERLTWEKDMDGIKQMGDWMISEGIATEDELEDIQKSAKKEAKAGRDRAWKALLAQIKPKWEQLFEIYQQIPSDTDAVNELQQALQKMRHPLLGEMVQNARRMSFLLAEGEEKQALTDWLATVYQKADKDYHTHLYSHSDRSALRIPVVPPTYSESSPKKNGYEILNTFFDKVLSRDPSVYAFGEDVGQIGDVNQGFANMQLTYGIDRVFDTGIREWTIMGQAIGMAMRGLRPIAEIQYLDYLIYGLEPLTDDLATLRYRSNNLQQAPAIIRTRGHRLEGIWHAGSPMGMMIHALRGMYLLVPRDMVQAAGMYNTLLQSDDPAIVVECLNGYRLKEQLPDNIGTYTIPLGVPECLQEGTDITLITYGSCVRVAQAGITLLEKKGISVELIDVQTLLPFDLEHRLLESLKKTNRVLFLDEDVPGGATAYMMRELLEVQGGYRYLDSPPITLTAKAHRPPYGSDGDYFTKPNPEDVYEAIYNIMLEADPTRFR